VPTFDSAPSLAGPYADVERGVAGTQFRSIRYVEETKSTNADAAELLGEERFGGLTIVAEYQSQGSGRKGRRWEAAAGAALLFSTILPRDVAAEDLWLVPFWTALAVRAGLRECGVVTTLQWPNDLLLGEGKIAGVLCQSSVTGQVARVACGVGINVRRWEDAARITPAPAFCDDVAPIDRRRLLLAILLEFERALPGLDRPDRLRAEWDAAAEAPGRRYRILPDGAAAPFEAVVQGLAAGGDLRVVRDDGREELVSLADARVLR
jgi:BirA family transcriptional regulator, biotin operon repressor / biotin---[acetyl-CoA-carboxylase] ligase